MVRWVALGLVIVLAVPPASAQPAPDAQALVDTATEEFRNGDYSTALSMYLEAFQKTGDRRLLYMIARCQEEVSELKAAVETYEEFLVGDAPSDAREKALARLRALREQLATGTLRIDASPDGATVLVDGEPKGAAPLLAVKLAAGDHVVEVRAEGHVTAVQAVKVPEGGNAVVAIALAKEAPVADPRLPTEGVTGEADAPNDALSGWSWGLLVGGLSLAAGGAVTYAVGEADHREIVNAPGYEGGPSVGMTRVRALELESRGDTLKTAGYALMGVGGGAIVGSAVLFILDVQQYHNVTLGAAPTLGGAGLTVGGSF